jgi:hypothetical protein
VGEERVCGVCHKRLGNASLLCCLIMASCIMGVWGGVAVGWRMPQRKLLGLGGGTRRCVVGAKFSGRVDG